MPRKRMALSEWAESLSYDEGERFLAFCKKAWGDSPMDLCWRTSFEKKLRAFWRRDKNA